MIDFIKPTKITWVVFVFIVISAGYPFFCDLFGWPIPGFLLPVCLSSAILTMVPFYFLKKIGLNVGRTTDYWGFADPNLIGWILIITIDLLLFYMIASAISFVWFKAIRK